MPELSAKRRMGVLLTGILLAATLIFIWGNSLDSRDESLQKSQIVERYVRPLALALPIKSLHSEEGLSHFTRKLAHFSEFFLLGLELMVMALLLSPVWHPSFMMLALIVFAAAAADELLQVVSRRGPMPRDVLLDCIGGLCGLTLVKLVYRPGGKNA